MLSTIMQNGAQQDGLKTVLSKNYVRCAIEPINKNNPNMIYYCAFTQAHMLYTDDANTFRFRNIF